MAKILMNKSYLEEEAMKISPKCKYLAKNASLKLERCNKPTIERNMEDIFKLQEALLESVHSCYI